jgi:hypothetical protein
MTKRVTYLYINGLGRGRIRRREKLVFWWWEQAGLDIQHAHVDWLDGQPFEAKLQQIKHHVEELFKSADRVILLGSSAGGSLAINTFYELRNKNIYAVNMHGRLRVGDYPKGSWYSLDRRAYIATDKPSQSFYDCVERCEEKVIPNLTPTDKQRLLVLAQLTDMVAPLDTMIIPDIKQHRSFAFGHSGGFLAHLIADRDLIVRFASH